MEYVAVVENVENMDKEQIEHEISSFDYYKNILSQIKNNNFVVDQTCVNEFAPHLKDMFHRPIAF